MMEALQTPRFAKKGTRVLLVISVPSVARRVAKEITAIGGEAVVATSAAECRSVPGRFDHGIFAFDLQDSSGIVLAAELMLERVVSDVEFLHPDDLLSDVHATGPELRKVNSDRDVVDSVQQVA